MVAKADIIVLGNSDERFAKLAEQAPSGKRVIDLVGFMPHASNGVAEGITPGQVVVDMSSISPMATKAFAKRINALGADYIVNTDAPGFIGSIGTLLPGASAIGRQLRRHWTALTSFSTRSR